MKNNIKIILKLSCLFLMTCLFAACDDHAGERQLVPSDIDLEELPWISSRSVLNVTLWTVDGNQITKGSQLQPNTSYYLKVKSNAPINVKVKMTDGFAIEEIDPNVNSFTTDRIVRIKTDSEIEGSIYVNFVPILYEDNLLVRERPQSFLIPVN